MLLQQPDETINLLLLRRNCAQAHFIIVAIIFFLLARQIGTASAASLTTLYSFTGGADGGEPVAGLVEGSDGNFYGTTQDGGTTNSVVWYGYGTVFKISAAGELTTLHQFSGADGASPLAGLVEGADGNFYGTTVGGGIETLNCSAGGGCGTVFRISSNGSFEPLYSFNNGSDGASPFSGLVQRSDGYFYGTTRDGGATNFAVAGCNLTGVTNCTGAMPSYCVAAYSTSGFGTVFKISPSGELTTLHEFDSACVYPDLTHSCPESPHPNITLVQGSDGSFYGATEGSRYLYGDSCMAYASLFSVTAAGTLTTLTMSGSVESLIQARDGNFYGTTINDGVGGNGTVFKMTPAGMLTTLYSFTGGADGSNPEAGLVEGSDGNFYGTASGGGTHAEGGAGGTVFQITPAGTLTTLYEVGGGPYGGLVQGSDGNFYGTTEYGGTHGAGSVFKLYNVNCSFSIHPSNETFTPSGGFGSISVVTSNGCIWTATNNDSFITITSGTSGSGNSTVTYSVAANPSTTSRIGTLSVAGQTFTVDQSGIACVVSLDSTTTDFASAGGSSHVVVTANGTDCDWTAASESGFITITSGGSGSGNGTVSYTVSSNADITGRLGTMTIAGQTFTVTQDAAPCSFNLNAASASLGSAGGSNNVNVTANGTNCSWAAVSNDSFITITSGGSGVGNGAVTYVVAVNPNTTHRTGTMTIADQMFTVTQAANGSTPALVNRWQIKIQRTDGTKETGLDYVTFNGDGTVAGYSLTTSTFGVATYSGSWTATSAKTFMASFTETLDGQSLGGTIQGKFSPKSISGKILFDNGATGKISGSAASGVPDASGNWAGTAKESGQTAPEAYVVSANRNFAGVFDITGTVNGSLPATGQVIVGANGAVVGYGVTQLSNGGTLRTGFTGRFNASKGTLSTQGVDENGVKVVGKFARH